MMVGLPIALSWIVGAPAGHDLIRLFPKRAAIEIPEGANVVRLALPIDVMKECQTDLSDVRIVSGDNRPIAYRLVRDEERFLYRVAGEILSAERSQRIDKGKSSRTFERYVVSMPPLARGASHWRLVLNTDVPDFIRTLRVDAIDASGHVTANVATDVLFRLPDMHASKTAIELPSTQNVARLRLSLEGDGAPPPPAYLAPTFSFDASIRETSATNATVPVEGRVTQEEGRTVVTIERPSGWVPVRLRLHTTESLFAREVEVFDADRDDASRLLGRAKIFRRSRVEDLDIAIEPAQRNQLVVSIADGDSATLSGLSVSWVLKGATLIFGLARDRVNEPLWLVFGGGHARAPRFDLGELSAFETAQIEGTAFATLRAPQPNDAYAPDPKLGAFMRPGDRVDTRWFSHRRRVDISEREDPPAVIALSPNDSALLRPDFADLRLVDEAKHQWPLLFERQTTTVVAAFEAPKREGTTSIYRLALPASPVWVTQVTLRPQAHFFSRPATLWMPDANQKMITLASERLVNNPTDQGASDRRVFNLSSAQRVAELRLTIEDGQESSLHGLEATLEVVTPLLIAIAPPGPYDLVLGNPKEELPRYDVENARTFIAALKPAPTRLGPLEPNPTYRGDPSMFEKVGSARLFMWGAIGLAIAVLGGLALKMARQEAPSPRDS